MSSHLFTGDTFNGQILLEYADGGTFKDWLLQRGRQTDPYEALHCGYYNCDCVSDDHDEEAGETADAARGHLSMLIFHNFANQIAEGLKFLRDSRVRIMHISSRPINLHRPTCMETACCVLPLLSRFVRNP